MSRSNSVIHRPLPDNINSAIDASFNQEGAFAINGDLSYVIHANRLIILSSKDRVGYVRRWVDLTDEEQAMITALDWRPLV